MDPTGLNTSVTTTHTLTNVGAGSYSVSVMAVNENGVSQAIMSAIFDVQSTYISDHECEHGSVHVFCFLLFVDHVSMSLYIHDYFLTWTLHGSCYVTTIN